MSKDYTNQPSRMRIFFFNEWLPIPNCDFDTVSSLVPVWKYLLTFPAQTNSRNTRISRDDAIKAPSFLDVSFPEGFLDKMQYSPIERKLYSSFSQACL